MIQDTKTNGIHRAEISKDQLSTTVIDNLLSVMNDAGEVFFFDAQSMLTKKSRTFDNNDSSIHLADIEIELQASRAKFDRLESYASDQTLLDHINELELVAERGEYLALFFERRAGILREKARDIQKTCSIKRRSIQRRRVFNFIKTRILKK